MSVSLALPADPPRLREAAAGTGATPAAPRLTLRGVVLTGAGYLVLAALYVVILLWGIDASYTAVVVQRTLIDYSLKAALTVPAWWILIRYLDRRPWSLRFLAHAIVCPVYIGTWFLTYYAALDFLDVRPSLYGAGRKWDVYIPLLVYALQFGIFHAVRHAQIVSEEVRRRAELKELAHQAELAALKAQINPHVLFNTLNAISGSLPADAEAPRVCIARLAELMRYTLDATRRELVTLDEEIRCTRCYLGLEEVRFGERLVWTVDVDAGLEALPVPPMTLQPLVENAVKHGIAPRVDGGAVSVRVRRAEPWAEVEVADTGEGSDLSRDALLRRGVGLGSTHRRLEAHSGDGLHIASRRGAGFRVAFRLPLAEARP